MNNEGTNIFVADLLLKTSLGRFLYMTKRKQIKQILKTIMDWTHVLSRVISNGERPMKQTIVRYSNVSQYNTRMKGS